MRKVPFVFKLKIRLYLYLNVCSFMIKKSNKKNKEYLFCPYQITLSCIIAHGADRSVGKQVLSYTLHDVI
jgi:hypothetical protein